MSESADSLLAAVRQAMDYVRMGRPHAAIATLEQSQVAAREAPEFVYFHARLCMQVGFWFDAEVLLAELLQAVPDKAVLVFDRATCLLEMGRLDEARRLLEQCHADVREKFPQYVLMARIAAATGDLDSCKSYLASAMQRDPMAAAMARDCPDLTGALEGLSPPPAETGPYRCTAPRSGDFG